MPGAVLLILLLVPAASSDSLPDTVVQHEAEAAFQEGLSLRAGANESRQTFRKAAQRYEDLRQRGVSNPLLLRDQGNAYLLAGDLPQAILAYRRGLQLDPNDHLLRQNLEHARAQVAYPANSTLGRPAVEVWPSWLPRPTPGMTLVGLLILYGAGFLLLTRWWMLRRRSLLVAGCATVGAALLLGAVLAAWELYLARELRHPLVVIAEDGILVRQGNGLSYPPRSATPVNRGVEGRLLFARGAWLKIELPGGEIGWVPRQVALVE